jgi:hypothetical protein
MHRHLVVADLRSVPRSTGFSLWSCSLSLVLQCSGGFMPPSGVAYPARLLRSVGYSAPIARDRVLELSSRLERRAFCGAQRRDRGKPHAS